MTALISSQMNEFREAIQAGIDGIVRASKIYVESIDEDSSNRDKFMDEFSDSIPASAWAHFEAVGRKWMHPKLLLGGVSDAKKSRLIKNLTYSLQEQVFNRERFKLLTHSGEVLEVDLLEVTQKQAEQLCNGKSIRTLSEQKAWIASESKDGQDGKPENAEVLPYIVKGGRVTFRRGCSLNKAEIKRLLLEI